MPVRVLILGEASRRTIIGAIRLFQPLPEVELLFGCQSQTFSQKIFLRNFKRVIPVHLEFKPDRRFIDSLIGLSQKRGGFVILPTDEVYIRLILENRDELFNYGITIRCPGIEQYELVSNKKSFVELCAKYGIQTPPWVDFPDLFQEPFVMKPQSSARQSNVLTFPFLVENPKSFQLLLQQKLDLGLHFCQKYIDGPGYYYCAFYEHGVKKLAFTQVNTCQQPNGKSVIKAQPAQIPETLREKIDFLFADLRWDGVMMFEVKIHLKTGSFYAIECNPRIWGPIQLCLDNGYDFFSPLIHVPSTQVPLSPPVYGYLWLNGYLAGWLTRLHTKTRFQVFDVPSKGIRFRSVWFRKDTWLFFLVETGYLLLDCIKGLFSRSPK